MKFISYRHGGRDTFGMIVGNGVVDLQAHFAGRYETLRDTIAAGALSDRAGLAGKPAELPLTEVVLLPPIPDPGKIIGIGRNYANHAAESGSPPPENPSFFVRFTNSLTAHDAGMIRPRISSHFDYEGELAVVIGKRGRHVSKNDALDHVFGYSCFNDGSIRDIQFKHSLAAGKNFISTGGFGPWIVSADEIPDPSALELRTRINGETLQAAPTADLIFDVPTLIQYLSELTELAPGDVIATGTPEGVGFARKPPRWLVPGDVVEVECSSVGVLRNRVVDEDSTDAAA